MSDGLLENPEFAAWLDSMSRAMRERDESLLRSLLGAFETARRAAMTGRVRRVAHDLQFALEHFHRDARLLDLAQRQVPDARHRLAHVLRLTDDAAHRTMDLVERSAPLADHASHEAERLIGLQQQGASAQQLAPQLTAFVTMVAASMGAVRSNLGEVLITQDYQDLSGQIIRGVMKLIQELEVALAELLSIAGTELAGDCGGTVPPVQGDSQGPTVPGVVCGAAVAGQQDVDALLSELGV